MEMPTILDPGHSHTVYGLGNLANPLSTVAATTHTAPFFANGGGAAIGNQNYARGVPAGNAGLANQMQQQKPKQEKIMGRRFVQVFIADSDENVPLEQSMLYTGEQKLTDATDQELFFEIDMKSILEKHNEQRVKIINKKVKERTEYLEPAKIRDLKMVVVNVASF